MHTPYLNWDDEWSEGKCEDCLHTVLTTPSVHGDENAPKPENYLKDFSYHSFAYRTWCLEIQIGAVQCAQGSDSAKTKYKKTTNLKTWAVNKHQMPLHWSAGKSQKQRKHTGRVDGKHAAFRRSCRVRTRSTSSLMGRGSVARCFTFTHAWRLLWWKGLSFEDKGRCTLTPIYSDYCSKSRLPHIENLLVSTCEKKQTPQAPVQVRCWNSKQLCRVYPGTQKCRFLCLCVRLCACVHKYQTLNKIKNQDEAHNLNTFPALRRKSS